MATEKQKESTYKEPLFRVQLRPNFVIPQLKGKPKEGVIYIRAGYHFCSTYGEGSSYHIVTKSELEKFKLAQNQQFANSPLVYEIDSNLVVEEVR